MKKKRRAWGNSGSFTFYIFERMIFMLAESLFGLLKQEDGLVKMVKEAQDLSEFYSDRANEYNHAMCNCDNDTMHEVFESDMQKCEMKAKVYREKELKARKELRRVRKEMKKYISFIMSEKFDEEEGDICGLW